MLIAPHFAFPSRSTRGDSDSGRLFVCGGGRASIERRRRVTYSSIAEPRDRSAFFSLSFSLFLEFRLVTRVPKLSVFSVYCAVLSLSELPVPRLACKMSRAHAPCLGMLFILPASAIFAAASGCSSMASLLHVRRRKMAPLSRMTYGGRSFSLLAQTLAMSVPRFQARF